jgi:sugar lactone lactonase YvrE
MQTIKPFILICTLSCALFSVSCYKSIPLPRPPASFSITTLRPANGPDSTQVTIRGTGFSDTAANDVVSFNGKPAVLLSASDSSLVAVVPTLAGTGDVTVTVDGKTSNGIIFTYDTTYRVTTVADGLSAPYYIAIDTAANLYVTTYGNETLAKITPQGAVTSEANTPTIAVTIDKYQNLYVAFPSLVSIIKKITPGGIVSTVATDSAAILDLAVDTAGNLYASKTDNSGNGTLDKITPNGAVTTIATGLFSISGVAIGPDGAIYVTNYDTTAYDNADGVVSKISPTGVVSPLANFRYSGFAGLTVDNSNNVYVTAFNQEFALGSVQKISPAGIVTTLVSANLEFPCGIVRDNAGNFYVVQTDDSPGTNVGSVVKLTMH